MSTVARIFGRTLPKVLNRTSNIRINSHINARNFFNSSRLFNKPFYTITYEIEGGGEKHTVQVRELKNLRNTINFIDFFQAKEGDNLLDIAINNDIDIDGFGACEGTLACSTCHVIFTEEDFAKIDDEATDEELDMLDLAFGLTDTSRLGCQVCMSKALDGVVVKVPAGVNDQR